MPCVRRDRSIVCEGYPEAVEVQAYPGRVSRRPSPPPRRRFGDGIHGQHAGNTHQSELMVETASTGAAPLDDDDLLPGVGDQRVAFRKDKPRRARGPRTVGKGVLIGEGARLGVRTRGVVHIGARVAAPPCSGPG
jgi:hypothetical protein